MHVHTHCLVLNRAATVNDGKWRALDGRALLAARAGAGAVYNRTLEAELTRRLSVAWRDRSDGLRELEGVDDELIEAFSSRRRAITATVAGLAAAYRDKYGADPPPAVLSAMAQQAWAVTRRRKRDPDPAEALRRWETLARRHGRKLTRVPRRVIGHARRQGRRAGQTDLVDQLLERLAQGGRATFTRHDLIRAALDVVPPGTATGEQLEQAGRQLVDAAVDTPELVTVTAPEVLDVPAEFRRVDGSSVYEQPHRQRWALRSTLDQEAWLVEVAGETDPATVDDATVEAAASRHRLGHDQSQAARQLLGCRGRVGLLVGPAGAGKTRTLRAVVDAWKTTGAEVVGLTVSQAAADVLTTEARVRTENTAKWLYETRRRRWRLPAGTLVIIDEASMVSTADLVALVDQARRAGGKVLLVGDPAQLAAIHIGGAFGLLVDRIGAARLHEPRRFTQAWERAASLQLRRRDPAALAEYAMRGRIHGGTLTDIENRLFDAWQTATLTDTSPGHRRSVLMIVTTNHQAAVLAERARHALIAAGVVADGASVQLRDNLASVGDHIVTRRNDRRLPTVRGEGWVVNGDVWTITGVHRNGDVTARRHSDAASITLPRDYLAAHTHLAYATTAHRAQGMTVDVCHAALTADATHQQLYVAATRGRHANHVWVALDSQPDLLRDPHDLPDPEALLAKVLARRDPDRLSAHQIIADSYTDIVSLARIGAIFEDSARAATASWLADVLARRGLAGAIDDPEWASLVARIRAAALAGHHLDGLVDDAVRMRSLHGACSLAAVLHYRVGLLASTRAPRRPPGPLGSLPPGHGPDLAVARQAADLMRLRWRQLRQTLAAHPAVLPWGQPLGARPHRPQDAAAWLTAATAVAAYRERYEVADHTPMLGPRPADVRPDAQAAWDHARLQADRYLARRLRHLTDHQLTDLDTRQHAILAARPHFDPAALEQARRRTDTAATSPHAAGAGVVQDADVQQLERQAAAHRSWRDHAQQATALRRQIALERDRRRTRAQAPIAIGSRH